VAERFGLSALLADPFMATMRRGHQTTVTRRRWALYAEGFGALLHLKISSSVDDTRLAKRISQRQQFLPGRHD
jgi:hypothetical protein